MGIAFLKLNDSRWLPNEAFRVSRRTPSGASPPRTALTAETNITFLAFLLARRAVHTLRRAFPGVRIVTAALDGGLAEVRFPLMAGVSGLAPGDAEYGSRLVARHDDARDVDEGVELDKEQVKVAWVVQPGMGHIGDRYYLD